jgi:hypothetical protein
MIMITLTLLCHVLQTSGENFLDQQFWLYLYGMWVAGAVHIISAPNFSLGSMAAGLGEASINVQVA